VATEIEDRWTARLHLRRVTAADAPAVIAVQGDPRTNAHRPGGAPSLAENERAVHDFVRDWREHGVGYWAVELNGKVIGLAGVRRIVFRARECWNLYYRFSPEAWGMGFAVEAAREAVAVADAQRPAHPVVARTRPSNHPAMRVAEKAGLSRRPDLDSDGFVVLARGW
jgi:RimJ/RimL family protein N-acetyltransferase